MIRLGDIKTYIVGAYIEAFPKCDLFHEDEFENIQSITAISVPFGADGHHSDDLILGLCDRCYSRLQDDRWMLIYCYECNGSRWIYKPEAKMEYRKDTEIIWLRGCPDCSNKFGAAYFTNQIQEN